LIDVLSLGEPLVQLNPLEEGPLRHVHLFEKHAAGSEVNVLIGLSRLGFKTCLIAKLGKDEFSRFMLATLKSEDVGLHGVRQTAEKNCGIYFVQRGYPIPEKSDVIYFRSDSAAKQLSPEDVDQSLVKKSKILHLTGITPALSDSCRKATLRALSLAKKNKVKVSFDTNYRKKLWSASEAKPVLFEIAKKSDFLFTDLDDAGVVLGKSFDEASDAMKELASLGPETIILKLGAKKGLLARSPEGEAQSFPVRVPVVDSIGAGDAVVSAFLGGHLGKESLQRSLDMASCSAALVVMRRGDFENLPDRDYLDKWLSSKKHGFETDLR
jgi:sugar/nucleoside kinase (ribokinase family)